MNQKIKLITGMIIGFFLSIGLDQWTKQLVVKYLMNRPACVILDGVFEFYYSENRGAAFGILQGKQTFFLFISLAVLSVVIFAVSRMPASKKYLPLHLIAMFLSAGAAGNMIDRFSKGYVVDFLYFKLINFPIFNVADCYVTVSMFVFLLLCLFYYKEEDLSFLNLHKKEEQA